MKARIPNAGGGASNMQQMLRQAQKMQEDMQTLQAELDEREYEISTGGGMVTLKINGKKEVTSLDIAPDIVDPDDIETLSDIIIAAVNEAIRKVEDTNASEMQKVTGSLSLPDGLPGGLF